MIGSKRSAGNSNLRELIEVQRSRACSKGESMNLNGILIGSENPQRLRASGATVVREPYQPGEPGAQEF